LALSQRNKLFLLNRFDEVRAIIQQARARNLDGPDFGYYLWMIALIQNDRAGMDLNEPLASQLSGPFYMDAIVAARQGRRSRYPYPETGEGGI
jgi:hypothetical protein